MNIGLERMEKRAKILMKGGLVRVREADSDQYQKGWDLMQEYGPSRPWHGYWLEQGSGTYVDINGTTHVINKDPDVKNRISRIMNGDI